MRTRRKVKDEAARIVDSIPRHLLSGVVLRFCRYSNTAMQKELNKLVVQNTREQVSSRFSGHVASVVTDMLKMRKRKRRYRRRADNGPLMKLLESIKKGH